MSDSDCIFCKIIAKEIPSTNLYESEKVLAFLDAFPLSKGHFLVIPKTHAEKMHQVPDNELNEILGVIKQLVSKAGLKNYNILQNNGKLAHQFVFHAHFHVIPKISNAEGLIMSWDAHQASEEDLKSAAKMYI
jgi:diadenosine tetraphosphate (Ap4A) HIT family hydrolase